MTLEVIDTSAQHFEKIRSLIKKKAEVNIATYNLYAGITADGQYTNDWGERYKNEVGLLLDNLCKLNCRTTIKIGKPREWGCPLKFVYLPRKATEQFTKTDDVVVNMGTKYPGYKIQDIDDHGYLEFLATRDIHKKNGVNWTQLSRSELLRRGVNLKELPPHNPYYYKEEDRCSTKTKNDGWDLKMSHIIKRWAKIDFEIVEESHTKLVLVSPNHSIFGGRNLTGSEDKDLSFYSNDKKLYGELIKRFGELK